MQKNDELDLAIEQLMRIIEKTKNDNDVENNATKMARKKRMDDYLYRKELDDRMRDIDLYVPPFNHSP